MDCMSVVDLDLDSNFPVMKSSKKPEFGRETVIFVILFYLTTNTDLRAPSALLGIFYSEDLQDILNFYIDPFDLRLKAGIL